MPQSDQVNDKESEADKKISTDLDSEKDIGLKRQLTLFNGIAIIVGCIIGSGIFVSPKGVLQEVGSVGASLIVWIICGVASMIGAYCYAELGCMIRDSGADYAYMYRAFGPFLAFLRLWIDIVIRLPCGYAISALTFAKYLIYPIFPDCDPPANVERVLAAMCIRKCIVLVHAF